MEKKFKAYLFLLVAILQGTVYAGYVCDSGPYEPMNYVIPIKELNKENRNLVERLDSMHFEKTSFIGMKFSQFIDMLKRAEPEGDVVAFSEEKKEHFEILVINKAALESSRVNFESRKISYLHVVDIACGQIRAQWTVDQGKIIILPTRELFEIEKDSPLVNPFAPRP